MAHLENWSIQALLGPYQAPEQAQAILVGCVTDHSKKQDGHYIKTSPIMTVRSDGVIVTHSGTCYTLGEPDPDYEAKYPDARARLKVGDV